MRLFCFLNARAENIKTPILKKCRMFLEMNLIFFSKTTILHILKLQL